MLLYLAASGHNNCIREIARPLPENKWRNYQTHPAVYTKFMDGLFVVRRCWAGLFSNLYLEQVMMRSVKSVGWLTRVRGFKDSSSLAWLLSMPAGGDVHRAIQDVTGLESTDAVNTHTDQARCKGRTLYSAVSGRVSTIHTASKELGSLSSGPSM